jgi:hypothetical protein
MQVDILKMSQLFPVIASVATLFEPEVSTKNKIFVNLVIAATGTQIGAGGGVITTGGGVTITGGGVTTTGSGVTTTAGSVP